MNTLILFSSKYGATEKCAELISKDLQGKVDLLNLKSKLLGDISSYDMILLGGGIYAGRIQGELKKFVEGNEESLMNKNIGLFLCCKEEQQEKVSQYMKENFPDWMVEKAVIKEHLGYELNLDRMNFFERFLMKSILKIKESSSNINHDAVKRTSQKINEMFNRTNSH